jgi:hypothetical protein
LPLHPKIKSFIPEHKTVKYKELLLSEISSKAINAITPAPPLYTVWVGSGIPSGQIVTCPPPPKVI